MMEAGLYRLTRYTANRLKKESNGADFPMRLLKGKGKRTRG
jgi:hypothetical protein